MKIPNFFVSIISSNTFLRSSLTISATAINGVLGLIFYMVVARNIGPLAFGVFTVAVSILTLIADIGDLGTDSGLIRFVSGLKERENVLRFLKLALEVKLVVWFLVLSIGWSLTPAIASYIFMKPELLVPIRISLIGVGGALFLSFSSHALQALQRYRLWSVLLISSNALRLLVVALILVSIGLTLDYTLWVYISIPFIFFVIALFLLPNFIFVNKEFQVAREFFRFNAWIFFISIVSAASSRLDMLLTTRLLSIDQVGIYSVAVQLTSFIPQLFFAIATVAAPKLASFQSKQDAISYLKKLQLFTTGIAFLGLLGIPVAYFIISYFYGMEYKASFQPFVILYLAQLIFLLALPVHQAIFYFFAKPKIFVPIVLFQLILVLSLGLVLITRMGIVGAAIAILAGNVFLLVIPALWVILRFLKD